MYTLSDIEDFHKRGLLEEVVTLQRESLITGFPFMKLLRPAAKNDGIVVFSIKEIDELLAEYQELTAEIELTKFVPASGAASRMFKNLLNFKEEFTKNSNKGDFLANNDSSSVAYFFEHISDFAFFDALKDKMQNDGFDIYEEIEKYNFGLVIDYLITEKGLNYGFLPKGLLLFHKYPNHNRSAVEEHLIEGAKYASNKNADVNLHFTVSPEHQSNFEELITSVLPEYEAKFRVKYNISYSVQKPSTDTISLDEENEFVRGEDGKILFRPGGHGALIHNLNALDSDLVFIKNIDNVTTDKYFRPTITYKKVIAAHLLHLRRKIFSFLNILTDENYPNNLQVDESLFLTDVFHFACKDLFVAFDRFDDLDNPDKREILISKLNRPIRVCGMVKNEGEPGGGPFWIVNPKNGVSLQIVESSQIDLRDQQQSDILKASGYFNPVDLIVSLKNFKGEKFDLIKFIDYKTGFISSKSYKGKNLRALELPGLWNGAMANWITIFVEVPVATFNPVKIVNDLLRKEHQ
jgi:hypothetical protein